MKKYLTFVEKLHRRVLTQELDRVVPVLADEGGGKSTLMVESVYYYESEVKDRDLDAEDALDHIVWSDADDFREKVTELPKQSAIAVMDAARMLNRKETMQEEQKELEKDLFDLRAFGHLIFLGFQSPRSVPEDLGNRRAKNLLYLPARGRIHGYSRTSMDEWDWQDSSELPDPDLQDSFPPLDGTDLWDEFRAADLEAKEERISPPGEEEDVPPVQYETAEAVKDDLGYYVSADGRNNELYLDADMISLEHDLSEKKATQVRKLLERDDDVVVEPYRVLLNDDVVKEVEPPEDEADTATDEDERDLKDIADEVFHNLANYIGEDGRTGDFLLDPDRIAFEHELSDRKARQVRKHVESLDGVSISDDVVAVNGEVVASQSRDV